MAWWVAAVFGVAQYARAFCLYPIQRNKNKVDTPGYGLMKLKTDFKVLQKAVGTQYIIVAEFSEHGGKSAPQKPAIDSFYSSEPEQAPQKASNETEI